MDAGRAYQTIGDAAAELQLFESFRAAVERSVAIFHFAGKGRR